MIASLTWIPRGAATAKLPERVDDGPDDASMDLPDRDNGAPHSASDTADEAAASAAASDADDPDAVHPDAQLPVDIAEVLANDLDALAFHKRGERDPYLAADPHAEDLFDDVDLEALNLNPTDSLIVAAKSGDDASTLEVHLFDDDPDASDDEDADSEDGHGADAANKAKGNKTGPGVYVPHHYIHHDLVLPALPLCAAYTRISLAGSSLNLVAVGMFTPGIDIWDADRVNNLEPLVALGGYADPKALPATAKRTRSRRRKKPELRDGSHSDAVMALSWNAIQTEYLASGSADCTVKVWDVESAHCATTLRHHSNKVQSVAFHPSQPHLLLTGSFDRSVQVVDVRAPEDGRKWMLGGDVETAQWSADGSVYATADDGHVSVFDTRQDGSDAKLVDWAAHNGPASACALSMDVPGLMVTGGVDKMIKVWDVADVGAGKPGSLVYERPSRNGALFALALCPLPDNESNASPFVVAFGGHKGVLGVMDLAVESDQVRRTFKDRCGARAYAVIERRAKRGTRQLNARKLKEKEMGGDDSPDEEEDGDDEGVEDGSESESE